MIDGDCDGGDWLMAQMMAVIVMTMVIIIMIIFMGMI
jgi:hypothetical protein